MVFSAIANSADLSAITIVVVGVVVEALFVGFTVCLQAMSCLLVVINVCD